MATTVSSASGAINFSGLSSGLDTNAIIEQLITVDSQPLVRLQNKQTELTTKQDTYTTMKSDLLELQSAVSDLKSSTAFNEFSASSSDEEALTVSATTSASEGNYRIKILSLAQAEALSSDSYTASDTSLNISGEIIINGSAMTIYSSDTLQDISNSINSLDSGVQASILKVSNSDNRLIITAESQGEEGFQIANAGSQDILGTLGFTDGTKSVREISNGAVLSEGFSSAITTIGSLTGISSDASGTVMIRNSSLSINLATDTLSTIRDSINSLGIEGVTATVEEYTEDSDTLYRLSITGTQDFTDGGNVLESLGILAGGTSGVQTQFQTGSLTQFSSSKEVKDNTKFTNLGMAEGETITISGTDSDGSTVLHTVEVDNQTKISDLLSEIEAAFSGNVTATLEDGKITVESLTSGESSLSVNILANNELGGTLDFGTVSVTEVGRERLVTEGQDARILVNNVTVSRSSNVITDALNGISLSLKEADSTNEIIITVERNTDEIKTKIENFVTAYNALVDFIDTNSEYDPEEDTEGPLVGDSTARSVLNQLRSILQSEVDGDDSTFTMLVQIGVETTSDGHLEIDSDALDEALQDDIEGVASLLSVSRTSTNSNISFAYSSNKTKAGSYEVVITQAAEKASVSSGASIISATGDGELTVTDNYGSVMTVGYSKSDTAADIVNAINTEARKEYAEIIQSESALKESDGDSITQNTSISDIEGVTITSEDSVTITGTNHDGKSFQRKVSLGSTTTVDDILSAIENLADDDITASISTDGSIQIQDKTVGASDLEISISSTISALNLGTFSTVQNGRNAVTVGATTTRDNVLTLTHTSYGSSNSFTVSGGNSIGITDGEYSGKDVAGTINGVEGTGNAQSLTASSSDASSQGIVIRANITAEDLATSGRSTATVTLVSGVADALYRGIASLTDSVGGFVQAKIDSFERTLTNLKSNISDAEDRIEVRRQMYIKKFAALESALSRLQSLQQSLSSTLSSLG